MLIGASVFFILGCVALLAALTGPGRVQWTGRSVQGTEIGGIVYCSYDGQNYSLDSTSRFMSNTVYFDPSHPYTSAMLGNAADRVLDIVTVAGPYAIATIILVTGTSRRMLRRRARRKPGSSDPTTSFGQGLDPGDVRRLIERNATQS